MPRKGLREQQIKRLYFTIKWLTNRHLFVSGANGQIIHYNLSNIKKYFHIVSFVESFATFHKSFI